MYIGLPLLNNTFILPSEWDLTTPTFLIIQHYLMTIEYKLLFRPQCYRIRFNRWMSPWPPAGALKWIGWALRAWSGISEWESWSSGSATGVPMTERWDIGNVLSQLLHDIHYTSPYLLTLYPNTHIKSVLDIKEYRCSRKHPSQRVKDGITHSWLKWIKYMNSMLDNRCIIYNMECKA